MSVCYLDIKFSVIQFKAGSNVLVIRLISHCVDYHFISHTHGTLVYINESSAASIVVLNGRGVNLGLHGRTLVQPISSTSGSLMTLRPGGWSLMTTGM